MAEDASHQLARQVVARLCQPLGWQGIQNGACDVLADLMKRYIVTLGKNAAAYVANGNRTDPAPEDVAYAFKDMDISFDDLATYARLVSTSPLPPLPQFPLPRHSSHIYSPPPTPITRPRPSLSMSEEDDEEEYDIIPPFFPPLPTKKEDDKDDAESGVHDAVDRDELMDVSDAMVTPADPNRGLPQLYRSRSRLSSDISEEGGEGGSRRGSFSDASGGHASLILRSTEANIGRIASLATTGSDLATQSRLKTPLEKSESIVTPHLPGGPSSGDVPLVATTSVGPMKSTSVNVPSNGLVGEGLSDQRAETAPSVGVGDGVSGEGEESGGGEGARVVVSSRPLPLHLMSSSASSDLLPVMSPLLSSPGSEVKGGVVNTSLPLLSPLCDTPILSNAPMSVFKAADAKVTMVTTSQTTNFAIPSPSLSALNSPHPPLPGDTKHTPTTSATGTWIPPQGTVRSPPKQTAVSEASEPRQTQGTVDSLSSESDTVEPTEHTGTATTTAAGVLKVKLEVEDDRDDEKVSQTIATSSSHATSSEMKEGSEEDDENQTSLRLSPAHPHTAPAPSPPPPPLPPSPPSPERDPADVQPVAIEEERDEEKEENESVISTGSSKPSSPEPTRTPELKTGFSEHKTGFSDDKTTFSEHKTGLSEHKTGFTGVSTEEPQSEFRMPDMVVDINMEGGGDGGVASILHGGEEEMDLPDIDKQLEMSESEEPSSSSSSGSEEEEEEAQPDLHQPRDVLESKNDAERGAFLEPPRPPSVRSSSSCSLASTPSVSPSPSPIPQPSPRPNPVPVSISDVVPIPYPKSPRAKEKRERSEASKPLIVRFSRQLLTPAGERKTGEGVGGVKRGDEGGGGLNEGVRVGEELNEGVMVGEELNEGVRVEEGLNEGVMVGEELNVEKVGNRKLNSHRLSLKLRPQTRKNVPSQHQLRSLI